MNRVVEQVKHDVTIVKDKTYLGINPLVLNVTYMQCTVRCLNCQTSYNCICSLCIVHLNSAIHYRYLILTHRCKPREPLVTLFWIEILRSKQG